MEFKKTKSSILVSKRQGGQTRKMSGENGMVGVGVAKARKCDVETVFACWTGGATQGVLWGLVRGILSISPVTGKPVPSPDKWPQPSITISK